VTTASEIEKRYNSLPADKRKEFDALIEHDLRTVPWRPLIDLGNPDRPTPQQQAYDCKADILFYGGAAGGGKTGLLVGLALTAHHQSIIYRREVKQLGAIAEELMRFRRSRKGWNGQEKRLRMEDGKEVRFGGMQHPGDEESYQGIPFDLIAWDEINQFLESQFRYLLTWNRPGAGAKPDQRCRIVCTSNPPRSSEGDWIIKFWAPWLDPEHPNPALPGELRWFVSDKEGNDQEVPDNIPIPDPDFPDDRNRDTIPRSRTFIPSSVDDNPYLSGTNYKSSLQALPEPLRSQMLMGDFTTGREDDAWQVIPSAWVEAAQDRWTPKPPAGMKMSALGVDPARGGKDNTVLTPRYGWWFGEQILKKGVETPEGSDVAALCMSKVRDGAPIMLDVVGGAGTAPFEHLKANNVNVVGVVGSKSSHGHDKSGRLAFINERAENWWRLREGLDPESGEDLALPPDRELKTDLCAPRWKLTSRGIQVEGKSGGKVDDTGGTGDGWGNIIKRLGRSPDKGDSIVYAYKEGSRLSPKLASSRPTRANRKYNPHRWRGR
jgi:hypothetical protein